MSSAKAALDGDVGVLVDGAVYNIFLQELDGFYWLLSKSSVDVFTSFTLLSVRIIVREVVQRAVTFLVNAVVLRRTSAALLGVANVRLTLLYSTICFFAREAFRRSFLRPQKQFFMPAVCNVVWLCPLVSLVVGILFALVWIYVLVAPEENAEIKHYRVSVWLYVLAAVVESAAEPLWIMYQNLRILKLSVVVEGLQNFLRSISILLFVFKYPDFSLLAFSISMVASSLLYTLLHYACTFLWYRSLVYPDAGVRKNEYVLSSVWPKPSYGLDRESLALFFSFLKHGAAKQFLTEGERYMMTFFNMLSFTDQGVLNVIYNLGSLFPRIFLAPLEESSYAYFCQHIERGKTVRFQDERTFLSVHRTLSSLLKLVSLVGLVIVVFGQSYSYAFLKIYAGEEFCSGAGPLLLKCFCTYIWLLAINGITECFMFAAMHNRQVDRHRYCLLFFCFVFLLSSFVLCRIFGTVGFILANCINIAFRIIYSFRFIRSFYQGGGDRFPFPAFSLLPNSGVQAILLLSLFTTSLSNIIFCCNGFFNTCTHVIIGAVLLFAAVMTTLSREPELAQFVKKFVAKDKRQKLT